MYKTFLCPSLNRANYSIGITLPGNSVKTSKTSKSLSKKGDQDLRVFSKSGLEDSHFSRFFVGDSSYWPRSERVLFWGGARRLVGAVLVLVRAVSLLYEIDCSKMSEGRHSDLRVSWFLQ
jgi:hypothetical protein